MADIDEVAPHFVVVDFWNDRGDLSPHIELRCSCGDWTYRFPHGPRSLAAIVEVVEQQHAAATVTPDGAPARRSRACVGCSLHHRTETTMNGTFNSEHDRLRSALKSRVLRSISGARSDDVAAEYVVNALMEWPEGHDLLRRLARHVDSQVAAGGS